MANNYLTPGVYVQEISTLPGSVVEVQSAIPAFIGFTEKTRYDGRDMKGVPEHLASFKDFEERFGGAPDVYLESVIIKTDVRGRFSEIDEVNFNKCFLLYESLYMFFANGGGECYVVSLGAYGEHAAYEPDAFKKAIESLNAVDDVTLLVMPEAVLLGDSLYGVQQAALKHCAERQNRFAIMDLLEKTDAEHSILLKWKNSETKDHWRAGCQEFRDQVGIMNLSYGAAYTPYIIADTRPVVNYQDLRGVLKRSEGQTDLNLADLDPAASEAVRHLEAAIGDMDILRAAVDTCRAALTPAASNSNAAPSYPHLNEAIIAYNTQKGGDDKAYAKTIKKTGKVLEAMLASLAAQPGALSPELVRHWADLEKPFLGKVEALATGGAPPDDEAGSSTPPAKPKKDSKTKGDTTEGEDADDASEDADDEPTAVGALIEKIPAENLAALAALIDSVLYDDMFNSVAANIERLADGLSATSAVYRSISGSVQKALKIQPPSASLAGLYAATDNSRGVWKAPANISLGSSLGLTQTITAQEQETLNVDSVAGKSINAIRAFPGKGSLVWGARTLDGNSLEWRYIPVRRFFIMVEESVRRATSALVFEPNDANLWAKVRGMIENYLLQKWKDGALMGSAPGEAFFVGVGLGVTMTEQDILEGRLIVDIGMAVVRPAEFIILRFMHKMQQS